MSLPIIDQLDDAMSRHRDKVDAQRLTASAQPLPRGVIETDVRTFHGKEARRLATAPAETLIKMFSPNSNGQAKP